MTRFISNIAFFSILILSSCSKKLIAENLEKVPRIKTNELLDALDSISSQLPKTFYSKISTKYKDNTQDVSFKTSIRMVKDSAMSALITFATFPIYNSLLTPDSLAVVNKRSKCFTKTQLSYIKDNFGISFDYKNVEELILGRPLAYDIDQKYFQIHDPYNYIVSSHRKREIKRSEKKEKFHDDIIIKYFLTNDLKNLKKMEVESISDTATIEVNFLKWEMEENYSIPSEVNIRILTPKNQIDISLNYEKIQINVPQTPFLVIPEEYEECK